MLGERGEAVNPILNSAVTNAHQVGPILSSKKAPNFFQWFISLWLFRPGLGKTS